MQIKKFEAKDMTEALRLVKQEFGFEAVILSARNLKPSGGLLGIPKKGGVEVTAATDTSHKKMKKINASGSILKENKPRKNIADYAGITGQRSLPTPIQGNRRTSINRAGLIGRRGYVSQDHSKELFRLYQRMLFHGVEEDIVSDLIEDANSMSPSTKTSDYERLKARLASALEKKVQPAKPIKTAPGKQTVVAFVGTTGVGKTTTIAKLAAIHTFNFGQKLALITLDNIRIAAIEQLKIYAKIIGIPLEIAVDNKDLKKSLKRQRDKDLILIDTAGMSQGDESRIKELKESFCGLASIEIFLLLSSGAKEKDLSAIVKSFGGFGIDGLIFTKIDETSSRGGIINQLVRTKIPVSYITNGQEIPENIYAADCEMLMDLILKDKGGTQLRGKPRETTVDESGGGDRLRRGSGPAFVANKNSDIFHCVDCKWGRRIKPQNLLVFESVADALNDDFKPCSLCNPDEFAENVPARKIVDQKSLGGYW